MTRPDRLHVAARELAEVIADRLARLEPEHEVLAQVERLAELLAELVARPRAGG